MDEYSKDDIRKMIIEEKKSSIVYYEARAKAWRSIKRKYKKDGTDFANYTQNFELASEVRGLFTTRDREKDYSFSIYYNNPKTGREDSVYLSCYKNISSSDPEYEDIKKAGRLIERSVNYLYDYHLYDYYLYTPDEVIAQCEHWAKDCDEKVAILKNDTELEEAGVKMYELLKDYTILKDKLQKDDFARYSVVKAALEKTNILRWIS